MAGKFVRIVSPDGKRGQIPEENLMSAISEGYTPEDEFDAKAHEEELQAEYGTLGQKAITLAEGASRGLSLGTSDAAGAALTGLLTPEGPQLTPEARERIAALNRSGADIAMPSDKGSFAIGYDAAREEQRNRADANTGLALTGEVAGALLPAALSGGTSAVARGLAATPAALAAKAGMATAGALRGAAPSVLRAGLATGVGGAVEGAITGATLRGSQFTTQELGDPREVGESLLAAASSGALLGGAMGALFGAGERALHRGASKLDELAPQRLDDAAEVVPGPPPDPETITLQLEARPLTAAGIPDPARGKWAAMLARSEAAQGGFDNAVAEGTAALRTDLDDVLRDINAVDEYAGIAAKKRANALNVGHPVSTQEVDGVLGELGSNITGFLGRNSRAALAFDGGLNAVERVTNLIDDQRGMISKALASGDIGEAYSQLDNLKRGIGRARGTKSSTVQDLMEQNYASIQRFMEDESLWGELAQRQKTANAAWSNRISAGKDARVRQFASEAGGNENRAANEWDQLKLTNSSSVQNLLRNVGDVGVADVEEAFRRNLRSMARDATERTKAWGTPELQGRAERITNAVKRIEDRMDAVALVRRDAMAGQQQMRQSTVEMLAGAASLVAPPVGWAITGTAQAGRRVLQAAGSASQSVRDGVSRAAATLVRGAGDVAGVASGRGIPAAEMVRSAFNDERFTRALVESQELSKADSPATQDLLRNAAEIEKEDPELADAYTSAQLRRAQMVGGMIPGPLSNAVFSPTPQVDPVTKRKVQRSVEASYEPQKALDRIAAGNHSPEDLKAVKTVYPAMWKRFQTSVLEQFKAMRTPPSLQTRLRVSYATGLNLDPSVEDVPYLQQIAQKGSQEQPKQERPNESAQQTAAQFKPVDADGVYAAPVDARLDKR